MLKRLNQILNIVMGSFLGVFIGHGVYVIWDYKTHPGLYDMQSAPWYTSILMYGVFTVLILLIAVVIKVIVRRKMKASQ